MFIRYIEKIIRKTPRVVNGPCTQRILNGICIIKKNGDEIDLNLPHVTISQRMYAYKISTIGYKSKFGKKYIITYIVLIETECSGIMDEEQDKKWVLNEVSYRGDNITITIFPTINITRCVYKKTTRWIKYGKTKLNKQWVTIFIDPIKDKIKEFNCISVDSDIDSDTDSDS